MSASMLDQAMASLSKLNGRATVALERKQRESAPAATVRLIRGDAIELEPVRWLWPGFLPAGMLTILGGAPLRKNDHCLVAGCDRDPRRRLA